ncbi:hypothetical protein D9M71_80680 [compost metagenome]
MAEGIAEHGDLLAGSLDALAHLADHAIHQRQALDLVRVGEILEAIAQRLHAIAQVSRGIAGAGQGHAQRIGGRTQLAKAIAHSIAQAVDRIAHRGHQPTGACGQAAATRQWNRAKRVAQAAYAVAQGADRGAGVLQKLAGGEPRRPASISTAAGTTTSRAPGAIPCSTASAASRSISSPAASTASRSTVTGSASCASPRTRPCRSTAGASPRTGSRRTIPRTTGSAIPSPGIAGRTVGCARAGIADPAMGTAAAAAATERHRQGQNQRRPSLRPGRNFHRRSSILFT